MSTGQTVLLLGGTGRTGRYVLEELRRRGIAVRLLVRSPGKVAAEIRQDPQVSVIEGEILSLGDEVLTALVRGCDAVISCLGHTMTARGIFGSPRDLVVRASANVCRAIRALEPAEPIRFILLGSVSVNRPGRMDARRGGFDRALVWVLRGILPPARDNQRAADFLSQTIGPGDPNVQWVVVRPDTLVAGGSSPYRLDEGIVASLFKPERTNMGNIAHYMCELVTDSTAWNEWRGKLPVIFNGGSESQEGLSNSSR